MQSSPPYITILAGAGEQESESTRDTFVSQNSKAALTHLSNPVKAGETFLSQTRSWQDRHPRSPITQSFKSPAPSYKKSQQKVILLKECIPTWKHAREDTAAKLSVYFFCRGISGMSRAAPSFCQTMGWALQISSSLQKAESRKTQRNPKSTHRVLGSCLPLTVLGWLLKHHEHCSIWTPRCRLWPEKADLVWVKVSEPRIVRLNSVTQPSPLNNWSYRLRFA